MHGINRSIKTQDSCGTRPQEKDGVPNVPQKLLPVSSKPSLHSIVPALDRASGWIERLVWKDGITLRFEANHQHWWEGVGELQDTQGSDECREQSDLRNSGGNDEGENPVYWHKGNPDPLAPFRLEEGELEEISADVVVNHFNANVAIKARRNDTGDQLEDIADCLPIVGVDTLVRWVVDVLALKSVANSAINKISEVDEELAAKQAFPEIKSNTLISNNQYLRWQCTHGRRISANRLGKSVAPPKEKTACIKPLILSRKLNPGGEPPVVEIGAAFSMPFGRRAGYEASTAV